MRKITTHVWAEHLDDAQAVLISAWTPKVGGYCKCVVVARDSTYSLASVGQVVMVGPIDSVESISDLLEQDAPKYAWMYRVYDQKLRKLLIIV